MPVAEQLKTKLEEIIAIESVADKPEKLTQAIKWMDDHLSFYPFVRKKYENKGTVSTLWLTEDTLEPDVLLYVHLDVVPGSEEMFSMREEEGKLIGRGVSDMKFAAPVYLHVLEDLLEQKPTYSLGVLAVTDEEQGGFNGAGYLTKEVGLKPKVVIMPDGGNYWRMTEEAKGACWLKITSKGKNAHASRPWEGRNSITPLIAVLNHVVKEIPNPDREEWTTTANIGSIEGGTTPNQVPHLATATVDIRYTPDFSLAEFIDSLRSRFPDLTYQLVVDKSAFKTSPDDKYVSLWIDTIQENVPGDKLPEKIFERGNGSADHHYFADVGSSVILSKPESGLEHTEEEWINQDSMELYCQVLFEFMRKLAKEIEQ